MKPTTTCLIVKNSGGYPKPKQPQEAGAIS
jgi:hypothetical protein